MSQRTFAGQITQYTLVASEIREHVSIDKERYPLVKVDQRLKSMKSMAQNKEQVSRTTYVQGRNVVNTPGYWSLFINSQRSS